MIRKHLLIMYMLVYILLVCIGQNAVAASSQQYNLNTIFQTDGVVWGFDFISPQELLVTLREGKLIYVHLTQNIQKQLPTPEIVAKGQGGLLDVHYRQINGNNYFYLTYSTIFQGQL